MRNRGSFRGTVLVTGFIAALLCLSLLFAVFAPLAAARESGAVSVEVSIAPCVRVDADGQVRGNVSAIAIHQADLLTILPR
ncbi:MAG: hypothetical protein H5T73_00620 [Actinobacteria bacterium]|nr:hypothetical protein [Actinomycetota bacterium]